MPTTHRAKKPWPQTVAEAVDDKKPRRPQYYFQVTSIPESEAP